MARVDPNLASLHAIAVGLGDLRERVVFVGGATAGLLVTDPLADSVRATVDVDAIVDAGLAPFHRIEERVAALGIARDVASGVVCRWIHKDTGIVFDLMPVDPGVPGFSNRWYAYAVATAQEVELEAGLGIRMVTAIAFVASKLAAFADRGNRDVIASHDLEDILNIVDGREELAEELAGAPAELREAIGAEFSGLLAHSDFENALPGLIADANRVGVVLQRLRRMADLGERQVD